MDIIENTLDQLRTIQTNFRKAPNRRYRKTTRLNKISEIETLRKNITDTLVILESAIAIESLNHIMRTERLLTGELLLTIDQK